MSSIESAIKVIVASVPSAQSLFIITHSTAKLRSFVADKKRVSKVPKAPRYQECARTRSERAARRSSYHRAQARLAQALLTALRGLNDSSERAIRSMRVRACVRDASVLMNDPIARYNPHYVSIETMASPSEERAV